MLLDRLLSRLDVEVEPFSVCEVRPGMSLRIPASERVMLHFVLRGSGLVRSSPEEAQRLEPCSLAVVPRETAHSLEASGEIQERCEFDPDGPPPDPASATASSDLDHLLVACGWVRVDLASAIGLFDQLREILVEDLSDSPQVRHAFRAILAEQLEAGPGSRAMKAALMSQCIVHLLRRVCESGSCSLPWLAALEDERLARVLDRVLERPGDPHSVESLATFASMSRSAFARSFAAAFGEPPMTVVRRLRLERAREILRQPDPPGVRVVARRVGFSSRSHFSREFKRHFGMSPVAFQEAAG